MIRLSMPDEPFQARALPTHRWLAGPHVKDLENAIAESMDVDPQWVVCVRHATDGLQCLTNLLRVYSAEVFNYPGALCDVPTWVDSWGGNSANVDLSVDLWGLPVIRPPMKVLDAAHRLFGAEHSDLVHQGISVVYSFGPQKELAAPSGGAVLCPNAELADEVRNFCNCYHYDRHISRNFIPGARKALMDDPTAEYLRAQYEDIDVCRERRQEVLFNYSSELPNHLETPPHEASGHLCVMRFSAKTMPAIEKALDVAKIEWSRHFNVNERSQWPQATALAKSIISLPCHTHITRGQVTRICDVIKDVLC